MAENRTIPTVNLSNGSPIPILGFGTWKSSPSEVTQAVKDAISCGYRHIDCAVIYRNEPEVGEGIRAKIQDGTVTRKDLFITGKLWNNFHSKDMVIEGLKKSLVGLGLDYLDLFLMHYPMGYQEKGDLLPKDKDGKIVYSDVDYLDTWRGMEEVLSLGLVRNIGISNFNARQITRLLKECQVPPCLIQIECHPYLQQKKLIDFCRSRNISVTAFSCLGSTPEGAFVEPGTPLYMDEPLIKAIAEKYKKTPAQVLIRYILQRKLIALSKSVTKSRIESNKQVFDFELTDDDMANIETLECKYRIVNHNDKTDHPHYPFLDEF